ncbi:MAG: LysE family translocator [Desulfobacula sp.]|uniref:LysE family translocator n=1 Tax=Desulfobacula sp. TaxID=2593537 RepID=UPI001E0C4C23|nr:LysE family translocator [Desulfobacula sp.]MBT4027527.1 LysE family translocator [Desulfobacula sp.]MBT5547095.1 LysE family translocator [Desulfobacula sp.]
MDLFLAVLLFAASTTVTPGPNNVMIMTSGLNHGIRKSLPHLLGISIGFPVMLILIGLGLGNLFEAIPAIHEIIKLIGVLYLLYLSWLIATSQAGDMEGKASNPLSFFQAVLFQWVNPKAWVVAIGAVSAYTSLSSHFYKEVMIIAIIFFFVAIPSLSTWLFFGVGLKRILKQPFYQKTFNIFMALLLVASIIPVVYELIMSHLA